MLRTPQARGKEAEDLACDAGLPMISETLTAMRTHHNSIHRYRRLLEVAGLSANMSTRLSEERCAMDALVSAVFPLVFKILGGPASEVVWRRGSSGPSDHSE
ncbi:hypothetical protein IVB08_16795 [Bradyrhizobium sp. 173]|uniref:hypothetical protein n=1 Tax=Bradyrhizobium sp. 173 TaxID=2782644 RepID=UPI001FF7C8BD|nr:hypothetical protein [Bradyrhizobium sp. 173]MCK1565602.1 hypothetical protein [Bradyrhizobium sp. 173]